MMKEYKHLVEGVSLSAEDIGTLEMWNWAVEELSIRESVSMFALKYGEGNASGMSWNAIVLPCQRAMDAFYADNEIQNGIYTQQWFDEIFHPRIFQLDSNIKTAVDNARRLFSELMDRLKYRGIVKKEYDTEWVFRGCYGNFIWNTSRVLKERMNKIGKPYRDGLFRKFKITALDFADNRPLADLNIPEFDEADREAMLIKAGLYDDVEECPSRTIDIKEDKSIEITENDVAVNPTILEIYDEIKSIVYADIHRPLKEAKSDVEVLANSYTKKQKSTSAYLYASAVIEWQLKNRGLL